eukprot:s4337_g5.t1
MWMIKECAAVAKNVDKINQLLRANGGWQSLGPTGSHRADLSSRFGLIPGTTFMLTLSPMVAVKMMIVAHLEEGGLLLYRPTSDRLLPHDICFYLAKREHAYSSQKVINYSVELKVDEGLNTGIPKAVVTCWDLTGTEVMKKVYATTTSLQKVLVDVNMHIHEEDLESYERLLKINFKKSKAKATAKAEAKPKSSPKKKSTKHPEVPKHPAAKSKSKALEKPAAKEVTEVPKHPAAKSKSKALKKPAAKQVTEVPKDPAAKSKSKALKKPAAMKRPAAKQVTDRDGQTMPKKALKRPAAKKDIDWEEVHPGVFLPGEEGDHLPPALRQPADGRRFTIFTGESG